MKRLFVAIPLTESLITSISKFSTTLQKIDLDGNFVSQNQLHFTIKFLGNIDEDKIAIIINLLQKATSQFKKFPTSITGVGAFPSLDRIQTVWIGAQSKELLTLYQTIQTTLNPICQEEHQDIIPHLTILRVKSGKNKPQLQAAIGKWSRHEFGTLMIDKVILYESILTPQGPKYTILQEFFLK